MVKYKRAIKGINNYRNNKNQWNNNKNGNKNIKVRQIKDNTD